MSTATFIGKDVNTGGDWQTTGKQRGTAGYWLSDTDASTFAQSLPAYVTSVVMGSANWDGGGPPAYRLTRPGGGTALTGRLYSSSTRTIVIAASDSNPHYLSIYCCDDSPLSRAQTLTVKDPGGATLASHSINYDFSQGVWVCFLVAGEVDIDVSIDSGPNFVVSGVTWDETEPPMATGGGGGGTPTLTDEDDDMAYLGDFGVGQLVVFARNTTGALTSGAATVYRDGTTTKNTVGVTVTAGLDGLAGFNAVTVDTSAAPGFYVAGHDYNVAITTGTVGGSSIAGQIVGSFSIRNRPDPVKSISFDTSGIKSVGG